MRSRHEILLSLAVALFLTASVLVARGVPAAHADTPATSVTVDQLMSAADTDRASLLVSLIDNSGWTPPISSHSGVNKAPFGSKAGAPLAWPQGTVQFMNAILTSGDVKDPANANLLKTEQSPGDADGIKKGDAIAAWARVCTYLPIYLSGEAMTYPDYSALVSKHKNDTDGGAAFLSELTSLLSQPSIKDKGPVLDVMNSARQYAELLEKQKPGSGVAYLKDGDQFRGFMADLAQFGLGFVASGNDQNPADPEFLSPSVGTCVQQSGQQCLNDASCNNTLHGDWCNPTGIHLGNPCLMAVSDIVYSLFTSSAKGDWKFNEIQPWAPAGPFTSKFQQVRGDTTAADYPCFFKGNLTSCESGVVSYWFASPAGEPKLVDEMLAASGRIAQYDQYLHDKISELNGTTSAPPAGPDVTKIGSPLSLPLPLSDVSVPVLIGRVIRQLLSVVGALALAFFVWGGLRWMLARGDSGEIAKAKKIIVAAVAGLAAIFASYALLSLIINAIAK